MAKLIVKDVDATWLVDLPPGESVTLGRSRDCDLPIAAPRASRRHAAIVASADGHRVSDLASTNGTLLNGTPVASDAPLAEVLLADGDVVDAAGCLVTYRTGPR